MLKEIFCGCDMKRHLLASTMILAASVGAASAEVTLSGSARMGVIDNFGADNTGFTSRARVEFTLSGETDGGLSFGASFRADNAADANVGKGGSVFMSGAFGKLSMGDVDGAANAAVGHVDGVGLTGLSDLNESTFVANGGTDLDAGGLNDTSDPSALYEYSAGDLTLYLSSTNPSGSGEAIALGAKYVLGNITLSAGYEDVSGFDSAFFEGTIDPTDPRDIQHLIVGVNATFGAVTLKARYGQGDSDAGVIVFDSVNQFAVSATYTADALSVTAFLNDKDDFGLSKAYGLGASYDLGGGAKVVGGYVKNDTADTSAVDLGVSFSF
jgi:outer membrane protein OmpU